MALFVWTFSLSKILWQTGREVCTIYELLLTIVVAQVKEPDVDVSDLKYQLTCLKATVDSQFAAIQEMRAIHQHQEGSLATHNTIIVDVEGDMRQVLSAVKQLELAGNSQAASLRALEIASKSQSTALQQMQVRVHQCNCAVFIVHSKAFEKRRHSYEDYKNGLINLKTIQLLDYLTPKTWLHPIVLPLKRHNSSYLLCLMKCNRYLLW